MDRIDQYPSNEQVHPSPICQQEKASYLAVWEERRNRVIGILKKHDCRHILDMGCGEGRLFQTMKFMPEFKRLVGIDIDINEIRKSYDRVGPITYHMFSDDPPEEPLEVAIYCGDLTIPYPSLLRERSDAITMVEVIEHLPADVLERLPNVLFGFYRPEVIIISTPNKEYNKCIKGFDLNTLRHWDHKFEWTRKEFQEWCEAQLEKFDGYEVSYQTVGRLHPSAEEEFFSVEKHGRCTQIAVFKRLPSAKGPYDGNLECFNEFNLERVKSFKFPSKQQLDNLKISYASSKWDYEESDHYEYSEDNTNLYDEVDPEWREAVWSKDDDSEKARIGNGQGWDDDDKSVFHSFDEEAVLHGWKSWDFSVEEFKDEPKSNCYFTKNKQSSNGEAKDWDSEDTCIEEESKEAWEACSSISERLQCDDDKTRREEDVTMCPEQLSFTHISLQKDKSYSTEDSPFKEMFDVESEAHVQAESELRRFNGFSQVLAAKIYRYLKNP